MNWYKKSQYIGNSTSTHSKWRFILMADIVVPYNYNTNSSYIGSRNKKIEKEEAQNLLKNTIEEIGNNNSNIKFSIQSEAREV